jgi:AraC-like DNA-binding protein
MICQQKSELILYHCHAGLIEATTPPSESAKQSCINPVTAIADEVGFCDYNYFCRVFKKEAGIFAKKYRRTIS